MQSATQILQLILPCIILPDQQIDAIDTSVVNRPLLNAVASVVVLSGFTDLQGADMALS
jgi:hypothetical protein